MGSELWKVFERLADDIEGRLRVRRADHVSGAAEAALQAFFPELSRFDRVSYLQTLVRDAGSRITQSWPNDYGDPTFTVVRRSKFRIEVIFWDQAFNPPHDHISCGAFIALHGHRLNRDFVFSSEYVYSDTLRGGSLQPHDCTYMREGDTHYIQPDMIHDMFWIDLPVTTVAVRCVDHPALPSGPPRSYLLGGLATVRPRFRGDATLNTLRRGVKTLVRLGSSTIDPCVVADLAKSLPLGDYIYLVTDSARLGETALLDMVDALPANLPDEGQDAVARLRTSIPDVIHRHRLERAIDGLAKGPLRLALGFLWLGQTQMDAKRVMTRRGVDPSGVVSEEVNAADDMRAFASDWAAS